MELDNTESRNFFTERLRGDMKNLVPQQFRYVHPASLGHLSVNIILLYGRENSNTPEHLTSIIGLTCRLHLPFGCFAGQLMHEPVVPADCKVKQDVVCRFNESVVLHGYENFNEKDQPNI